MKRLRRRQQGQDLAEYALILPIFLMIVFAILDMGRAVYYWSTMQNAVREGARYGIIDPDARLADIETVALSKAVGLDPARTTVLVNLTESDALQVQMTYQFQPVTPIVALFLGSTEIPLQTEASMQVER